MSEEKRLNPQEKRFNPRYNIYKPRPKTPDKGAASSWEFDPDTCYFWLTVAKQNPVVNDQQNATFDWANAQRMRFGPADLGELIAVFGGRKDFLGRKKDDNDIKGSGLYHQNAKGNAVLSIYKYKDTSYVLEFSTKRGSELFKANHMIELGEACYLEGILKYATLQHFLKKS